MVDLQKKKREELGKLQSYLHQLSLRLDQEEEQRHYFLKQQNGFQIVRSNNWYQKDPELLQKRLDDCHKNYKHSQIQITEEQDTEMNLRNELR